MFSLGGGYLMVKSRALAERQRQRALGDYSVSVDRSGTSFTLVVLAARPSQQQGTVLLNCVLGGGI